MDLSDISRVLRAQAWERAKGELRAMLHTYHSPHDAREGQFDKLDAEIDRFVKHVESESLFE